MFSFWGSINPLMESLICFSHFSSPSSYMVRLSRSPRTRQIFILQPSVMLIASASSLRLLSSFHMGFIRLFDVHLLGVGLLA